MHGGVCLSQRGVRGYVTYNPTVPGDMQSAVKQLEDCIAEIRGWMINRMLKLNDNKTEMVIYMSQYHLNKHGRCDMSIGDSTISPVECVRNLGVQIDQHLTMDKQVTAVCKACNFHLYRLSSIRRYITTDAARSVVQALVTSRLDYCNSLLANLTNTQMKRLKSIQHKAARLVTRTPLDQFLSVRSQFASNQHINSVRIATFQSANFGPLLFAFYCPLLFYESKIKNE